MIKCKKMDSLYDFLFHYNHISGLWTGFKRSEIHDYFNGNLETPLRAKKMETLIRLISETEGDISKIKKKIKE